LAAQRRLRKAIDSERAASLRLDYVRLISRMEALITALRALLALVCFSAIALDMPFAQSLTDEWLLEEGSLIQWLSTRSCFPSMNI